MLTHSFKNAHIFIDRLPLRHKFGISSKSYAPGLSKTDFIKTDHKTVKNFSSYEQTYFKASDLKIHYNKQPRYLDLDDPNNLIFGKTHTDHMLRIDFDGEKWLDPLIYPYSPLQIDPFNSTLHYGLGCFEGMKAFRGIDGKIRMMRPWDNMSRLQSSMKRIAMLEHWEGNE